MMQLAQQHNKRDTSVSFEDTCIAFREKSNRELMLSYLIFWMTSKPWLVKLLSRATKFALSVGLPIKGIIKATVFKQFCGGENSTDSAKVIRLLEKSGIGTILDYSIEGNESEEAFESTAGELLKIIDRAESDDSIPCTCLKMTAIGAVDLFETVSAGQRLTAAEDVAWQALRLRLGRICSAAAKINKPLYIDAEESWIQKAVDDLVEEMMATYNKNRAIIFTTLQFYRWDRLPYFKELIANARAGGYRLGVKFVRGAYMEKERERARQMGYRSPINDTKAATDHEYNEALKCFIDNIDVVELCAGTHNEESCKLLARYMAENGIPVNHPHIHFSQLYGMSDHISYNLARAGYNVTKYLPFGPVEATIPYLVRRAEENTAIAGQMGNELRMISTERRRRKAFGRQCRAEVNTEARQSSPVR